MGQSSQPHELGGGLKSRHVTMLSIAGVIGASLFVGSSVAIAEAGPAVLLAYLFAGLLVVMIMKLVNDRKNSLIPRRKIFRIIVQRFPRPHLMESNRKGITTAYCNVDCKLFLWILRFDIIIDEPAKNRRVYNQFRELFI